MNVITILAPLPTGTSGLMLAFRYVEIGAKVIALIDMGMPSNEALINSSLSEEGKALVQSWHSFKEGYNVYNVVLIGGVLTLTGVQLVRNYTKIGALVFEVPEKANLLLSQLRQVYGTAADDYFSYLRSNYVKLKEVLRGVSGAGKLATQVEIQASLSTIANLKSASKLTKAIGGASDVELAAIHKYTENGGILNNPMRNGSETVIGPVTFSEFQSQIYQAIKSGLIKLRQTTRLVTGTVIRGRTYTLADFSTLFKNETSIVPLKGLVSCTKNEAVAIDFLSKTGASISGSKVKVIMKIKSKNGVDIDDMSDWGINLVNQRHPGELIQEEVLLEEGMFKMIGEPKLIKTENGIPWYEVNLEELGIPLRTIN